MKKVLITLASLIMAASVYAADATAPAKKVTWDFAGSNVEYKAYLYNSEVKGGMTNGKDEDFVLVLNANVADDTKISFKWDTNDGAANSYKTDTKEKENNIEVLVNKKFSKYIEAQVDLNLLTDTGFNVEEDNDSSKVFIKYRPNDSLTVKFAPFDIDLGMGTEFPTDVAQCTPGVQVDKVFSDKFSGYAGIGTKTVKNKDNISETAFGIKAGFDYKPSDAAKLSMYFSTNTQADDIKVDSADPMQTGLNVLAGYNVGKIELNGEILYVALNKAAVSKIDPDGDGKTVDYQMPDESGTGTFIKAAYKAGNIMKDVAFKPYVSYKNLSEYFYFDDSDSFEYSNYGGLDIVAVGAELTTAKGLTVTPELEFYSAENKVYKDKDGEAKDSAVYLSTKVKYTF